MTATTRRNFLARSLAAAASSLAAVRLPVLGGRPAVLTPAETFEASDRTLSPAEVRAMLAARVVRMTRCRVTLPETFELGNKHVEITHTYFDCRPGMPSPMVRVVPNRGWTGTVSDCHFDAKNLRLYS